MALDRAHLAKASCAKQLFRFNGFTAYLTLLSLLGVALVLAREATYGVALHWDSIVYASTAQNLLAGEGFSYYDGSAYQHWPPFYPLLLAALSFGVFDPLEVAGPLNAGIFGLTVFIVGRYLHQRLESLLLAAWASMAVAISVPLADWASWALSGTPFILLATSALICTDKFLVEGRTPSLVWAAVFSALAWQTRYMGAALPMLIGLLLLLQQGATLRQRMRPVVILTLITALPMVLWLLTGGESLRRSSSFELSLPTLLQSVLGNLLSMVNFDFYAVLHSIGAPVLGPLFMAALTLVAFGLASVGRQEHKGVQCECRPFSVFGGFALAYLALLLVAAMLVNVFPSSRPRYLTPMYIPLLMVFAFALDRLLIHERRKNLLGGIGRLPVIGRFTAVGKGAKMPSLMTAILMAALALWAAGQVVLNAHQIIGANRGELDRGYGAPPWTGSETLRHIREHPLAGLVYSNLAIVLHLHNTGAARPLQITESRLLRTNDDGTAGKDRFEAWLAKVPDGAHVVWFKTWRNHLYGYGAADLSVWPGLEPVADLTDGAIFKVNRGHKPASNPYRQTYESIASADAGPPTHRSFFDVYLDGSALTYFRSPCTAGDVAPTFFLHLFPADLTSLPRHRQRLRFDNLDFNFQDQGLMLDGACLAIVPLPDYKITRIRTGQYTEAGEAWSAAIASGN